MHDILDRDDILLAEENIEAIEKSNGICESMEEKPLNVKEDFISVVANSNDSITLKAIKSITSGEGAGKKEKTELWLPNKSSNVLVSKKMNCSRKRKLGSSSSSAATEDKKHRKNTLNKAQKTPRLPLKKIDQGSMCGTECQKGSVELGKECLQWMISPTKLQTFITQSWEKQPLYIKRETKDYYKHLFSCKSFDTLLRNSEKPLVFGKVNILLFNVLLLSFYCN